MEQIKIAISGELGSGKSVLSNQLSTLLGLEIISVGKIQRLLAQKYGMTTLEFNQYMETNPKIDEECDLMVTHYGLEPRPLLLDSRLAWHFVPHSFKVHLLVNPEIAAKRVFNDTIRKNEKYNSIESAKAHLIARRASELSRFKQQYGLDMNLLTNYDLVIDTSNLTPEQVLEQVLEGLKGWRNKRGV